MILCYKSKLNWKATALCYYCGWKSLHLLPRISGFFILSFILQPFFFIGPTHTNIFSPWCQAFYNMAPSHHADVFCTELLLFDSQVKISSLSAFTLQISSLSNTYFCLQNNTWTAEKLLRKYCVKTPSARWWTCEVFSEFFFPFYSFSLQVWLFTMSSSKGQKQPSRLRSEWNFKLNLDLENWVKQ